MMDVNTGFFAGVCFGKAKRTIYPFVKCSLVPNFLKQPPHSIFSCNYKPGGWPHFRGENRIVKRMKIWTMESPHVIR